MSTACWRPFRSILCWNAERSRAQEPWLLLASFHVVVMQEAQDHWAKPSVQERFHVYHWKGMVVMFNMCTFDGGASLQMLEDHK